MLKPKFVHGVNAEEFTKSLLPRVGPDLQFIIPAPVDPVGDPTDDMIRWTWALG